MTSPALHWQLTWDHGEATVYALGGMLAPVRFGLGDGQSVSPMHVAPWASLQDQTLPGLLRGLRGEWPCLPFGTTQVPAGLGADWEARDADDPWDHGYAAHHPWSLLARDRHRLHLGISYPAEHPIERLERILRVAPGAPALEMELIVHARRDVRLPFALHPSFAVPDSGVELVDAKFAAAYSYPVQAEPGVSCLIPGGMSNSLQRMPGRNGPLDLTRFPLPFATEELLQLAMCRSPLVLRYLQSRIEVLLDWDCEALPDVMLWISNGGRRGTPWNGRHFALGVEPVNGFFDLGRVLVPPPDHPLRTRRGLLFSAATPRRIRYRLWARQATAADEARDRTASA